MLEGTPIANAIALDGFTVTREGAGWMMAATLRWINTKSGLTYATSTCTGWGPATKAALKQLMDAMEQDAGSVLFGTDQTTQASAQPIEVPRSGLLDYLESKPEEA